MASATRNTAPTARERVDRERVDGEPERERDGGEHERVDRERERFDGERGRQRFDHERERVQALLARHGWNATSFQVLEPGFSYWFDGDDACVAYARAGGAWVAAGAPIASEDRLAEVAARFVAHARRAGRRACFFAVESRFVDAVAAAVAAPAGDSGPAHGAPALRAALIGEQPAWDPREWPATLRASRSLREQLRRARARGVTARVVEPGELGDARAPLRAQLDALIARWLAGRAMAPMGFLVDVQPFHAAAARRYVVAARDWRVVGLLVAVPVYARAGWLFEDMVREPTAPNGTAEVLVDAAMRAVAAEGSRFVTLGLAPLAGPVAGWLSAAREHARALYDFRGLRAFRARLRPRAWAPVYLCHPPDVTLARALLDTLAAFARGSLVLFGLATLLRGPALVVRALAVLLVPWTAALALADTRRWFPAPWVHLAWVLFDLALVAALFSLASRVRAWLAALCAAAVTADAALTLLEAAAFNAPRARGPLDWVVIVVSCAAPALAAAVLWGAFARARQLSRPMTVVS